MIDQNITQKITQKQFRSRRKQLLRDLYQINLAIALLKRLLVIRDFVFTEAEEPSAGIDRSSVPPYLRG